jgi:hypothetical protein
MSSLLKNLIIALVITVLLGVVYFFTIGNSSDEETLDEYGVSDSEVVLRTQKILADTQRVDEYALDVSIFDDRRFVTLQDFSVAIPDVQTGRSNPFAPIQ